MGEGVERVVPGGVGTVMVGVLTLVGVGCRRRGRGVLWLGVRCVGEEIVMTRSWEGGRGEVHGLCRYIYSAPRIRCLLLE